VIASGSCFAGTVRSLLPETPAFGAVFCRTEGNRSGPRRLLLPRLRGRESACGPPSPSRRPRFRVAGDDLPGLPRRHPQTPRPPALAAGSTPRLLAPPWEELRKLVLDSVSSGHSRRAYGFALDDFFAWCSAEPLSVSNGRPYRDRSRDNPDAPGSDFDDRVARCLAVRRLFLCLKTEAAPEVQRGGAAAEGGVGMPSTVLGSISSLRVPSGSNRFT